MAIKNCSFSTINCSLIFFDKSQEQKSCFGLIVFHVSLLRTCVSVCCSNNNFPCDFTSFYLNCSNRASLKSSDYCRPASLACKRPVRVLRVVPLRARVVLLRAALKSPKFYTRFVRLLLISWPGPKC